MEIEKLKKIVECNGYTSKHGRYATKQEFLEMAKELISYKEQMRSPEEIRKRLNEIDASLPKLAKGKDGVVLLSCHNCPAENIVKVGKSEFGRWVLKEEA